MWRTPVVAVAGHEAFVAPLATLIISWKPGAAARGGRCGAEILEWEEVVAAAGLGMAQAAAAAAADQE
jgi:hypothetical protein